MPKSRTLFSKCCFIWAVPPCPAAASKINAVPMGTEVILGSAASPHWELGKDGITSVVCLVRKDCPVRKAPQRALGDAGSVSDLYRFLEKIVRSAFVSALNFRQSRSWCFLLLLSPF